MLCNITSNLELEPIEDKSNVELSISNNQGLQYSVDFPLIFKDLSKPSSNETKKSLQFGNFYPTFGPYQGGTKVYFSLA